MKTRYHPKAFLTKRRNVRAGLASRTRILNSLENGAKSCRELCKDTTLSYYRVTYHLKSMRRERLVEKSGTRKPFRWSLTPYGQQELESSP